MCIRDRAWRGQLLRRRRGALSALAEMAGGHVSYADRTKRPPRTLSDAEQAKLLKVSGQHADTFRDHMIFSLALGTALREGEICALDVRDVMRPDGHTKRSIQLRHFARKGNRDNADARSQVVHLPDGTFYKLEKYIRHSVH